ncbi:MAG: Gldg family protein, partial [Myxococcota bacterium]
TAPTALVKRFDLGSKSARIVFEDPTTKRFTKIKLPTEEAMTNALIELVERRQRKVYFLGGHGEPSITDANGKEGYGTAATLLGNEGLATETLSLIGRSDVPEDASAIIVVEPKSPVLPNEAEALKAWLDRGGRALVLLDPGATPGLERVFRPFGVVLGEDMVVDDNPASRALGFGRDAPVVQAYETHPITNVMQGQFTMFYRARSVTPRLDLAKLSISTLIQTSPSSWAEKDWATEEEYVQGGDDLAGPVPIALAVTKRTTSHPRMLNPEARLVVIGDHHFATNRFSAMTGNSNLFVNTVNWLVGDEDRITIRPPRKAGDRLAITAAEQNGIMFFSVNLLPLLIIGIGFSVWAVRRRR